MKTEFDVTLSIRDMYRFSMYHTYTGTQGILSIIIAALACLTAFRTRGTVEPVYTILYTVFGVVFIVYIPVSLYLRTKKQLLTSEALSQPLHYAVDEEGIHTSQNGDSADLPWEQVYKMIATKHNVLVYSNRVNAFVIPRDQIAEQYMALWELAKKYLPKYRYRMK